ncbi:heme ABC transporter ATP-binding protein [Pseudoalteromonas sp. MMG012]|uniref:heme ABC transporter ATP-binding protein n=1 Tax=Pseudoalteromonas sp. MMG012 TaxID=2822686 RepID=UPI001B3A0D8A|nr:heme ABC transporter ATP-binding protein [Pseudoalteromonas sp. MMG012]MBQ4851865.1 heme ABC transporter ATP-binding protein [Pseudoalteromonas sp. MMG012]
MIEAKNITVKVAQNTLLHDANLTLNCGQLTVILGPNGAGKSTLLKSLCGDIPLTAGQVEYQQLNYHEYDAKQFARMRAVLTQNYDCDFPFTVQEIVDMSHFVHADSTPFTTLQAYSKQAINTLNVSHLINKPFTQLSGGEKQRVQFARVLCQLLPALENQEPCYLLIDEPTASLDLYHQYQVMQLARDIANKGAGVLAVVHDLALAASFADNITMLENGRVVAYGKPDEVLTEAQLAQTYQIKAHILQNVGSLPSLQVAKQALSNA